MAGGARCRVRSGGGLRSSGRIGGKSTGLRSGSTLSTREQQDDLLRRYPGAAYIVTRRRSEPAAGAGASDEIISFDTCRSLLYHYYDVTRLCGSDSPDSVSYRDTILEFCGIQVSPDELDKKASTSTNAAPHL